MKDYTVYFELYGRKMRATVIATSEEKAREAVLNKVIFHKVECLDIDSLIKDIFGSLGIKRK